MSHNRLAARAARALLRSTGQGQLAECEMLTYHSSYSALVADLGPLAAVRLLAFAVSEQHAVAVSQSVAAAVEEASDAASEASQAAIREALYEADMFGLILDLEDARLL